MSNKAMPEEIAAEYFDGQHAQAHPVRLRISAGSLHIEGNAVTRAVPLAQVQWPERTRHGMRMLHLAGGGTIQCRAGAAWDQWSASEAGRRDAWVVRLQQRWRWVLLSLAVLVLVLAAAYQWGVPWLASRLVVILPASVDESIGEATLASLDAQAFLKPTQLSSLQQRTIRDAFDKAVARLPASTVPRYRLEFRSGKIGPNAFALPGGAIILTDELVDCVKGDRNIIAGVLGHELGHLRYRHGMRMLAQAAMLGAVAGALYGDFSSLMALAPVWLGQAAYSRDAEREADVESVRLMRANGIAPDVMVSFFRAVEAANIEAGRPANGGLGIALASHPASEERIAFFKGAARVEGLR